MKRTFEVVNDIITVGVARISGINPKAVSKMKIKAFEDEVRAQLHEAKRN